MVLTLFFETITNSEGGTISTSMAAIQRNLPETSRATLMTPKRRTSMTTLWYIESWLGARQRAAKAAVAQTLSASSIG